MENKIEKMSEVPPEGFEAFQVVTGSDELAEYVGRSNWERFLTRNFLCFWKRGLKGIADEHPEAGKRLRLSGTDPRFGAFDTDLRTLNELSPYFEMEFVNLAFVTTYRNFEAFIASLCLRAFQTLGDEDAWANTKRLMIAKSWESKVGSMRNKFGLTKALGKKSLQEFRTNNPIDLYGINTPITALQLFAEVRHRVLHSDSTADEDLLKYSDKIKPGARLQIQGYHLEPIYYWLLELAKFFDNAFLSEFKWEQVEIDPGKLTVSPPEGMPIPNRQ